MNRTILTIVGVLAAIAIGIGLSAVYTVHQTQQAMVLQFGDPVRVVQAPGLHWKVPVFQNVVYFDKRLLDFDADPQEVILQDQKRLVVDAFARYRIVDPLLFFQTVGTENAMRSRLGAIVIASLRNVLGSVPFSAVLTSRRSELMRQIRDLVVVEAKSFGVEVVDVRIMRADLHPDNSPAIFARMQTERDRTVLLADAQRQASILRGQGDAEATRAFADAYSRDAEFYAFYRSLQAYRNVLSDGSSTLVLTPDSDFFRYFRDLKGSDSTGSSARPAPRK